jgi:hypothetical protein
MISKRFDIGGHAKMFPFDFRRNAWRTDRPDDAMGGVIALTCNSLATQAREPLI